MRFTLLIIICMTLSSCGGMRGKNIKQQPFENIDMAFDFGTKEEPKLRGYLVSKEKPGANYASFEEEKDIYSFFNFNQLNKEPQLICHGVIKDVARCTSFFQPNYKKMTGLWKINKIFSIEPWGTMKQFVSNTCYVQFIQYKGNKYQTAVIPLPDVYVLVKEAVKQNPNNQEYKKAIKIILSSPLRDSNCYFSTKSSL